MPFKKSIRDWREAVKLISLWYVLLEWLHPVYLRIRSSIFNIRKMHGHLNFFPQLEYSFSLATTTSAIKLGPSSLFKGRISHLEKTSFFLVWDVVRHIRFYFIENNSPIKRSNSKPSELSIYHKVVMAKQCDIQSKMLMYGVPRKRCRFRKDLIITWRCRLLS